MLNKVINSPMLFHNKFVFTTDPGCRRYMEPTRDVVRRSGCQLLPEQRSRLLTEPRWCVNILYLVTVSQGCKPMHTNSSTKQHNTHFFASLPKTGCSILPFALETLICRCIITTYIYGYLGNGIVRDKTVCDACLPLVKI